MKNCSYICGVQTKNIILFVVAGFFISAYIERRNSFGSPISRDFCTAKYGNVLGRTGDSAAHFSRPYYNFSYAMTKNVKDCKDAQGASIATSTHETGIQSLLKEPVNPAVLNYHRDNLIKSVDRLILHHELPRLSEMLSDFIYFLSHPECTDDFDKSIILDYATCCITLLGNLSNVYEKYGDFKTFIHE